MTEVHTETAVRVEPASPQGSSLSIARDVLSLAFFDHAATAVTQTPNGSLLAGFIDRRQADAAIDAITEAYPTLITSIDIADDAKHDWATSQRGGFTPTRVGRWHIRTPWTTPPDDIEARFDIQIDPAEAFGHGAHPSTKLAVHLMVRHLNPQTSMVDLGTGTGVLAIIAARAGTQVRAIDNSPAAIEAAQRNIALNSAGEFSSVSDLIDLSLGDVTVHDIQDPQLVVANVTMDVQRVLAPKLQDARRVIASGVLCSQVSRLRDLYPSHFAKTIRSVGEWSAVEFLVNPMSNRGALRT